MLHLLVWSALAASALASYGANLNYRSPSLHHPGLGISLRKVVKRNDPRSAFNPAQLNFTHGVASGDPTPNSVIIWTRCSPQFDDVKLQGTSGLVPLYNPVPIYSKYIICTEDPHLVLHTAMGYLYFRLHVFQMVAHVMNSKTKLCISQSK